VVRDGDTSKVIQLAYLDKITLGIQTRMRLMIVIVIDRRESND
jgi:hypothetical protein